MKLWKSILSKSNPSEAFVDGYLIFTSFPVSLYGLRNQQKYAEQFFRLLPLTNKNYTQYMMFVF